MTEEIKDVASGTKEGDSELMQSVMRNNDNLRRDRAEQFVKTIENESEAQLLKLRAELSDLELQRARLLDFGPTNRDDLTVGLSSGKASVLVQKIQDTDLQIHEIRIAYDIAKKRHASWFDRS